MHQYRTVAVCLGDLCRRERLGSCIDIENRYRVGQCIRQRGDACEVRIVGNDGCDRAVAEVLRELFAGVFDIECQRHQAAHRDAKETAGKGFRVREVDADDGACEGVDLL